MLAVYGCLAGPLNTRQTMPDVAPPVVPVSLINLSIKNFLAVSEPVNIQLGPFTVLVGKNDVGKSTILKALNLLLAVR
jgi:ABC-type Mn2+/Zn2+ transport system ATPase subunit